jgi:probable FeS assembly SUF system protein SufT
MNGLNASNEPIVTTRDAVVTTVPGGVSAHLPAGSPVHIAQMLGGSITLRIESGVLVRLDGHDADVVGMEPVDRNVLLVGRSEAFSMERVTEALGTVYDPEIPISIVELGLIYRCDEITTPEGKRRIEIDMTMTAPGCGMGDVLRADAMRAVSMVPGVDEVEVEIVWEPPWGMDRISEEARLELGLL